MKKYSVLIVDDDQGPRESMKLILEATYNVYAVASVDEGLAFLKELPPHCIIMDINMPGRDGIDGLQAVREINLNIPVIMCTAFASLDTAQQALRLDANDYIRKPFKSKELLLAVEKQITRNQLFDARERVIEGVEVIEGKLAGELAEMGMAASALVHDLRNPLTSLLGSVYLLEKELQKPSEIAGSEPGPEVQEYMRIINKCLNRCSELTHSWKSITDTDNMQWEMLNLGELVKGVCTPPPLDDKGLSRKISYTLPPSDISVQADRNQLERLLGNLIHNAVKATHPTEGEITIAWRQEGDSVRLSVSDNGVGIGKSSQLRILEPFYSESDDEGSGLGLFIVKRIIDLHGGQLSIESDVGQGATFIVSLPLEKFQG